MSTEKQISASALITAIRDDPYIDGRAFARVKQHIDDAPAVDAVEAEKYNDLREAFVDYVCSGVPNPAPYCKNRCPECVEGRGWCTYEQGKCRGFNPDGERREGE